MATYINKFYNQNYQDSRPFITTEATPTEYKGYKIYHRVQGWNRSADIFDVVNDDDICIGMYAGINGAKGFIDTIKA